MIIKYIFTILLVAFTLSLQAQNTEAAAAYQSASLRYLQTENIEDAIIAYQNVLKKDVSFLAAHYQLGMLYFLSDQFDSSLKHFDIYLQSDNTSDKAVNIHRIKKEITAIKKAFPDDVSMTKYKYSKQIERIRQSKISSEEAIVACNKLIALYPKFTDAYILKTQLLINLERYVDAANCLNDAIKRSDKKEQAELEDAKRLLLKEVKHRDFMKRAMAAMKANNYKSAAALFSKAHKEMPDKLDSANAAAHAYVKSGEYKSAAVLYQVIKEKGSWQESLSAGKQLRYIEQIIAASRDDDQQNLTSLKGSEHYIKAKQLKGKNRKQALEEIDQAIDSLKIEPVYSRYFRLRAEIKLSEDDIAGAHQDLKRALTINPNDGEARTLITEIMIKDNKPLEALTYLHSMPVSHRSMNFYLQKIQLEIAIEDYKAANESLKEAKSISKNDHENNILKSWQDKVDKLSGNLKQSVNKSDPKDPKDKKKKPVINFDILK